MSTSAVAEGFVLLCDRTTDVAEKTFIAIFIIAIFIIAIITVVVVVGCFRRRLRRRPHQHFIAVFIIVAILA